MRASVRAMGGKLQILMPHCTLIQYMNRETLRTVMRPYGTRRYKPSVRAAKQGSLPRKHRRTLLDKRAHRFLMVGGLAEDPLGQRFAFDGLTEIRL